MVLFSCFFCSRPWLLWSWGGAAGILAGTGFLVHLNVLLNDWFGDFYNLIQKALSKGDGAMEEAELYQELATVGWLCVTYIVVAIVLNFFTKHWCFRWRTALTQVIHISLALLLVRPSLHPSIPLSLCLLSACLSVCLSVCLFV